MSERDRDDALRRAFMALGEGARASGECPAPEEIWTAATGEAQEEAARKIIAHMAGCSACAEDWRLARGLEQVIDAETTGVDDSPAVVEPQRVRRPGAALAVAASVLLAVAAGVFLARRTSDPRGSGLRTTPTEAIQSLLSEDEVLPRDRCLLRWSVAPRGARYDVIVTTEDLDPILEARDLDTAELIVPSSDLEPVPSGEGLLWRVEATLPDGSRIVSPTFGAKCH